MLFVLFSLAAVAVAVAGAFALEVEKGNEEDEEDRHSGAIIRWSISVAYALRTAAGEAIVKLSAVVVVVVVLLLLMLVVSSPLENFSMLKPPPI